MNTPTPTTNFEERTRRFDAFDRGAFNIMELALGKDITPELLREIERDIRLTIPPEAKAEMLIYTDEIQIIATGSTYRSGWWWNRKVSRKNIHVDVIFSPYRIGLSVWTDPKVPGGVVRFQ